MRILVSTHRLKIARLFEESRTAKEPGRPIFNQMIDLLKRGEADGIVCWDIDRLYRNPIDEGTVRWMLQRGGIRFIRTPQREYLPSDAGLLMAIEGGRATEFIIRLSRDIRRGQEAKLLAGGWPAPTKTFGYIYDHNIKNIAPHPGQAAIVRQIFEEFSSGTMGLSATAHRLAELGVVNSRGKTWAKHRVHDLLTNKLYVGIMPWRGRLYEGKYKPIITPELFSRVAEAIKVRSKPRRRRNRHDFPFLGIFHCSCGSMMTAQIATGKSGGRYRYYRCTRKTGTCDEPYIQEDALAMQCAALLSPIALDAVSVKSTRTFIDKLAGDDETKIEEQVAAIDAQLLKLQVEIDRLTHGYVTERIDEQAYNNLAAELLLKKRSLKRQKRLLTDGGGVSWIEPAREVIEALELAAKQQAAPSLQEMSRLVRKIGSNPGISRRTVGWELVAPYDSVAQLLARRAETAVGRGTRDQALRITSATMWSLVHHLRTYYSSAPAVPTGRRSTCNSG